MSQGNDTLPTLVWCNDTAFAYDECRESTGSAFTYCVHSASVLEDMGVTFPGPKGEPGACVCNIYFWLSAPSEGDCSEANGGNWRRECLLQDGSCSHSNIMTPIAYTLHSINCILALYLLFRMARVLVEMVIEARYVAAENKVNKKNKVNLLNNPLTTTLVLLVIMPFSMLCWALGYIIAPASGDLRANNTLMRMIGIPFGFCSFFSAVMYLTLAWDTITRLSSSMSKSKSVVIGRGYKIAVNVTSLTFSSLIAFSLLVLRESWIMSAIAWVGFFGTCALYHVVGHKFIDLLKMASSREFSTEKAGKATVAYQRISRLVVRYEVTCAVYLSFQVVYTIESFSTTFVSGTVQHVLNTFLSFLMIFLALVVDVVLVNYLDTATEQLRGKNRRSASVQSTKTVVSSVAVGSSVGDGPRPDSSTGSLNSSTGTGKTSMKTGSTGTSFNTKSGGSSFSTGTSFKLSSAPSSGGSASRKTRSSDFSSVSSAAGSSAAAPSSSVA